MQTNAQPTTAATVAEAKTALSQVTTTPEQNLISSLVSTTAPDLIKASELPAAAYVNLLSIQKNLTVATAATAPTLAGMVRFHGEAMTVKLICAVLKLYNDSLNTSQQMSARQLLECADLFTQQFANDSLKDLILCLKRAKLGLYGTDYNRIDSTVIARFFQKYLDEKAEWLERQHQLAKHASRKATNGELQELSQVLTPQQWTELKELTRRPFGSGILSRAINSATYLDWLVSHVHELDEPTLLSLEREATQKNDQAVLAVVTKEQHRRLTERA